jgi:hypothetical protein
LPGDPMFGRATSGLAGFITFQTSGFTWGPDVIRGTC